MNNLNWLNKLKVGDSVVVVMDFLGQKEKYIQRISRITPTRQIVIGNHHYVNGRAIDSNRDMYLIPLDEMR